MVTTTCLLQDVGGNCITILGNNGVEEGEV